MKLSETPEELSQVLAYQNNSAQMLVILYVNYGRYQESQVHFFFHVLWACGCYYIDSRF